MARVRFNLKRPKANTSAIVCTVTDGRDYEMKLTTGISIKPKHWSAKGYVLSADNQASAHNAKIKSWSSRVLDIYNKAVELGIKPEREYFYNELKPQEKVNMDFWDHWSEFIASRGKKIQADSLKKYNTLATHLESFEKTTKKPLKMEAIRKATLEDFQDHLIYNVKLNTQTTAKTLKFFKAFLNWSLERRYLQDDNFTFFKVENQPPLKKIILEDKDLEKIRTCDVGQKKYLKNVAKLLILACYTGLRFSDFSRISKQHLKQDENGEYYLNIRQQKTSEFVDIPLTDEALEIVNGLISGKVKPISNQKMNKYVKELGEKAKINEPIEVTKFKGNQKETTIVPKHDLISSHTGRRTFCTRLLNRGVPAKTVMEFSGHKDYKSFQEYVNIPKKVQMDAVRRALILDEGNAKMSVA